jgi:hypothetical protein
VSWRDGHGALLARVGGAEPGKRAELAAVLMSGGGLEQAEVVENDDGLWARQRAGQRSDTRALVRVAARPSSLADLLGLASACGASLVGRAALGTSYVESEPDEVPPDPAVTARRRDRGGARWTPGARPVGSS